jgi:hypothetical protein
VTQWDLEVLASELRRHSGDLSLYAGFLLSTLSSALPAELVEVERKGSLLGRLRGAQAPVVAATVRLGDQGFTLRTETVGLDEWSHRLAAALGAYADRHAGTAEALRRFTLPDAP